jgi:transcription antitermination factor NusG
MKLPSAEKDWFVARCRVGTERLAADELEDGGFEIYLPQRRVRNFVRRQRLMTNQHQPAMPGYLFVATEKGCQIDWGHLRDNSSFRHVGRPLRGLYGPLRIPAAVIIAISVDEMNGKLDEVGAQDKLAERFAKGTEVRAVSGSFANLMAIVESVTGQGRIKALTSLFGRMTTVEFEPEALEVA